MVLFPPSPGRENNTNGLNRQRGVAPGTRPPEDNRPLRRRRTRAPRRNTVPEWMKKSPDLRIDEKGNQIFTLHGKDYVVKPLGEGSFHKAFVFETPADLLVGQTSVKTDAVVLKILNSGEVGPNKQQPVIEDETSAYRQLKTRGVPVATVYIEPTSFEDKEKPTNGKFWLVEKIHSQVDATDWEGDITFEQLSKKSQNILNWAKSWLNRMAQEKQDLINDFRIRNTMMREDGNPVVIDFSKSEEEKWEKNWGLYRYALDWANGNRRIFNYLTSEFPEKLKQKIAAWETEEQSGL